MSVEDTAEGEVEASKKVDVLAYLKDTSFSNARTAANNLDPETDYYVRRTRVRTKRYLIAANTEARIRDDEEWDRLQEMDLGDARLETRDDETEYYETDPDRFATEVKKEVWGDMDVVLPDEYRMVFTLSRLEDGDENTILRVRSDMDRFQMLKHPSEVGDEPWEDGDEKYVAMKFKFTINGVSPDTMDFLTEKIIEPFIDELGRHEHVGRVRWLPCETTTKETGACYNL
jgi:hypothetical protein